jgi:Ras-related protein Rab-14
MNYILIGNKADLAADRQVTVEEAKQFAGMNNMPFFEVSAKTGVNVFESFNELATRILGQIEAGQIELDTEYGVRTGPEYKGAVQSPTELQLNEQGGSKPTSSRCRC